MKMMSLLHDLLLKVEKGLTTFVYCPIRGQYWGHVTSIDQSEDNILQMKQNSNIQTHTHAHSGNTITDEFDDDEKFLKTT